MTKARLRRSWGGGGAALRGAVEAAWLSQDGRLVFWRDQAPALKVADAAGGEFLFSVGLRGVRAPLLGPSSELVVVSEFGELEVWDVSRRAAIGRARIVQRPREAALSPDGGRLAGLAGGCELGLWSVRDGKPVWLEQAKGKKRDFAAPAAVRFSPDGGRVLAAGKWSSGEGVFVHDAADGRLLWSWSGAGVCAAWMPDGRSVAVCQTDPEAEPYPTPVVRILSAEDGREKAAYPGFWAAGAAADGGLLLGRLLPGPALEWRGVSGAHAASGRPLALATLLDRASLSADGGLLLTWGPGLRLCRLGQAQPVWERGPASPVAAAGFAGDGTAVWADETGRLCRAALDGEAEVVGELGEALPVEPPRRAVDSVALGPGCATAAALLPGGAVRVWDLAGKREAALLPAIVVEGKAGARFLGGRVALSRDGGRLAAGCGTSVGVWDAARGAALGRLDGHPAWVAAVALSPDGRLAVSSDKKGGVKAWDLVAMKEAPPFPQDASYGGLAFSPDGRWLARLRPRHGHIQLWDAAARSPAAGANIGSATAFTQDGRAVVGVWDKVRVLDPSQGKVVLEASWEAKPEFVDSDPAFCAAVSPDGRLLLAGTRAGTVHLIELIEEDAPGPSAAPAGPSVPAAGPPPPPAPGPGRHRPALPLPSRIPDQRDDETRTVRQERAIRTSPGPQDAGRENGGGR